MPKKCPRKTSITIDHESQEALVDTTLKAVATQPIRCGFKELGDTHILPYRSFVGQADQIRFRLPKGQGKDARHGGRGGPGCTPMNGSDTGLCETGQASAGITTRLGHRGGAECVRGL